MTPINRSNFISSHFCQAGLHTAVMLLCAGFLVFTGSAQATLVITATNQNGTAGTYPFTPTWSPATNSLIAGLVPGAAAGNFSEEAAGRNVDSLTANVSLAISSVTGSGGGSTCSTNYVTCGNGYGAGALVVYTLPAATNGYNLTNITVYGGWQDNGRNAQACTVSYSTVGNPAAFTALTAVNYAPAGSSGTPSATRVVLADSAGGVIASNVAAVQFDFTTPASENGYCGYAGITVQGTTATTSPVNPIIVTTTNEYGPMPLTPTWSPAADSLIAGLAPVTATGNFSEDTSGRNVDTLTEGGSVTISQIAGTASLNYVTGGNEAGALLVYTLPVTASGYGYNLTNITVYSGWQDNGRDAQAYTVAYATVFNPTEFVELTPVNYNPAVPGGVASANRVTIASTAGGVIASNVAAVQFDFTTPPAENGYCGYGAITVEGTAPTQELGTQIIVAASNQSSNNSFVPGWTMETNSLIAGQLPSSVGPGNFAIEAGVAGVSALTDGVFGPVDARSSYATCGSGAGQSVTYALGGATMANIVVYSGWLNQNRDGQFYNVSYSTVGNPTAFIPLTSVYYNPAVTGISADRVSITTSSGVPLATNVAFVQFDFTPETGALDDGYSGYAEIIVGGAAPPQVARPAASAAAPWFAGNSVALSEQALGASPFFYQWECNGVMLAGATNSSLWLTNLVPAASGDYQVSVSNYYGVALSSAFRLTVNSASAPLITTPPASVTNYLGGLATFAAGVAGSTPMQFQWQHAGTNLPHATASSLTLANLQYGEAGNYTLAAVNAFGTTNSGSAVLTVLPPPNPSALNVLTYHNDNTREGLNTNEVLLTPATVNASTFGRLITYPTDGYIYTQPLYVSGLAIPGQGTHNAVFVATENDTVYAFDADNNAGTNGGLLWQTNLGLAALSNNQEFGDRYNGNNYTDIVPEVGISGTPVIDPASGTLYVNVRTRLVSRTATNYFHFVHALNITNGAERTYSPAVVTNSVPGVGVDSANGVVTFNPVQENQRPGLTLAGGVVYVAYGSFADTDPYHGWVIGFNATNLQTSGSRTFNTTPNASVANFGGNAAEGALWMGGNGLCADASNNLYFMTGNGSFSANVNGGDYSDSFVKLATTNSLKVADYFTPYNQAALAAGDVDLGSGGPILLPAAAGSAAHPNLLVGAGKEGTIHLVDGNNMGHYNSTGDGQIVQEVRGAIGGAWSTPAYFNHEIYFQGSGDVMKAFFISNAVINPAPVSAATTSFSALGGTPSISANGTSNGIVWTIQSDAFASSGPAVLHAYNATNLAQELYNSSQNLARDNPGPAIKMTTPTVINGKVFVGTQYGLSVFGSSLFVATPVIAPAGGLFTNAVTVALTDATPNSTIYYTLDGTMPTLSSPVYTGPFVLTSSASVQAIAAQPGAASSGVVAASFVDSSALGSGSGLRGAYWSNVTSVAFTNPLFVVPPTLVRTDAVVNFNWAGTPPAASIGLSNFVARWTGTVQPEYGETYTFSTVTTGGARLFVNGQLLIDKWFNQPGVSWSNSITLKAQQLYNIEMDFFNQTGGAAAQLYWKSPSTPNAIIPQSQLYPYTNPPPSVVLSAPANGTSIMGAASVSASAEAAAQYNPLEFVNFYTNGVFVASVSNAPYALTLTGLAAGSYTVTASATDGSGLTGTSAPVAITVTAGSGLPYGLTTNATLAAFLNENMPGSYAGTIPAVLSATGAFADTPNRIPAAGLIPYVPNTPLWSDNAIKSRFMGVPFSGAIISPDQQIGFAATGSWTFPSGTVFVKNFDLVVNATNASVPVRRLETRLLVRDTNGAVYGVTYKWRPDNSDADLLASSLTEAILITNATGVVTQNWYYPSPADCLTCHTPVAGYVLGVNTRQLNGAGIYPASGVTDNQLRTLNRLGLFNPAFNEAAIGGWARLSSVTNTSVSLAERARSYLDANCAQCHQPGGSGPTFDARYDTPLASQNIINAPVTKGNLGYDHVAIVTPNDVWRSSLYDRMNTVNPAIKMPALARNLIDSNAVATMAAWIDTLGGPPALPPPVLNPTSGTFTGYATVTAEEGTNEATLYYTVDGSLPTTNSLLYTGPILVTNSLTININAWASGYANSVVDSAQYTILPGLFFVSPGVFTNGLFQMTLAGAVGSNYILQVSTNLVQWTPVSTNTPAASPFVLTDPASPGAARFYRVRQGE